eukprot:NODE_4763_length_765_cov_4.163408_g4415_i0.p1 GENE.NODE_4763_length_765_cov_4.163408_g4415_i0~~NODE_4763_length_765_cov_4.163408_g4415_i0.p1  ORF type:complete len:128 (+),score=10.07 NODE_4763_length_765_cov_4.163408_g4415_i0:380-763(+)
MFAGSISASKQMAVRLRKTSSLPILRMSLPRTTLLISKLSTTSHLKMHPGHLKAAVSTSSGFQWIRRTTAEVLTEASLHGDLDPSPPPFRFRLPSVLFAYLSFADRHAARRQGGVYLRRVRHPCTLR